MEKIAMVKKEVQLQNWSDKEIARQESGLTVTQWCMQEKISTSAYYYRLRKIRENLCKQIPVPVTEIKENTETDHAAIRIVSGDLKVEGNRVYRDRIHGYAERDRRSRTDSGGFCR